MLGGHNLNARRPRIGGVRSNGCLIFCGALPVMCLSCFFLSCNIEAGAPDRQEIIRPDVVRAGVTAEVVVCFIVVFGALFGVIFFLHFHSATSKWARSGI